MRLNDFVEQLAMTVNEDIKLQTDINSELSRRINALERAVKALAEAVQDR
jgi:hypothetical protein